MELETERNREERGSAPAIQGPANTEFEFGWLPYGRSWGEPRGEEVPQTERVSVSAP